MLASMAGIELLHSPYKGEGQALTDLLGGQIQMQITGLNLAEPHVKSGRLRLLAVTSKTRMPSLPHVPTVDESGLRGFESLGWIGIYAPAKTPAAILQRLASEWRKARATPEVSSRFEATGMNYIPSGTPEEFAAFQRAEVLRWDKVIQKAGIKPE
jgi:tripartite-type tricarboxylate transporter receptor subunit TctC